MEGIQWRGTEAFDFVLEGQSGVRVLVLTGNGLWLARQAVATGEREGLKVVAVLSDVAGDGSGGVVTRLAGWPRLGQSMSASSQLASVIAAVDPTLLPVTMGTGVFAVLAQPAIEWLQERDRESETSLDPESWVDEVSDADMVVLDPATVGTARCLHVLELVDRRRDRGDSDLRVVVVLDELVEAPHAVSDQHDEVVRKLVLWEKREDTCWTPVPPLSADEVEALLSCEPLLAALLVDESGVDFPRVTGHLD